jgi:hypothetical protein
MPPPRSVQVFRGAAGAASKKPGASSNAPADPQQHVFVKESDLMTQPDNEGVSYIEPHKLIASKTAIQMNGGSTGSTQQSQSLESDISVLLSAPSSSRNPTPEPPQVIHKSLSSLVQMNNNTASANAVTIVTRISPNTIGPLSTNASLSGMICIDDDEDDSSRSSSSWGGSLGGSSSGSAAGLNTQLSQLSQSLSQSQSQFGSLTGASKISGANGTARTSSVMPNLQAATIMHELLGEIRTKFSKAHQMELSKQITACRSSKWASMEEARAFCDKLVPLLATVDSITAQSMIRKLSKLVPQQYAAAIIDYLEPQVKARRKILAEGGNAMNAANVRGDGGVKRKLGPGELGVDVLSQDPTSSAANHSHSNPMKKLSLDRIASSQSIAISAAPTQPSASNSSMLTMLSQGTAVTSASADTVSANASSVTAAAGRQWKPSNRASRSILEMISHTDMTVTATTAATGGSNSVSSSNAAKFSSLLAASKGSSAKLSCSVCREMAVQPRINPQCCHVCCQACWAQWMTRSKTCPMCRVPVDADKLQFVRFQPQEQRK